MLGKIVFVLSTLALARAQIPSLGWCPEYVPMANFDMERFTGVWYEAERFLQITDLVSHCMRANYTKGMDGKFRVSNEVINRFTGVRRILDGEIKAPASKVEEGKLQVKYSNTWLLPLPETQYSVLETDYKSYAVLWSCSGLGPVHTQNAWVMTREQRAPGEILQKAHGVLDKYKISKALFVKVDQDDCPSPPAASPIAEPQSDQAKDTEGGNEQPKFADIAHDSPNAIVNTKKAEIQTEEKKPAESTGPAIPASETISEIAADQPAPTIEAAEPVIVKEKETAAPSTVPELILKVAEKESVKETAEKIEQAPKEIIKEQENTLDAEKNVA